MLLPLVDLTAEQKLKNKTDLSLFIFQGLRATKLNYGLRSQNCIHWKWCKKENSLSCCCCCPNCCLESLNFQSRTRACTHAWSRKRKAEKRANYIPQFHLLFRLAKRRFFSVYRNRARGQLKDQFYIFISKLFWVLLLLFRTRLSCLFCLLACSGFYLLTN